MKAPRPSPRSLAVIFGMACLTGRADAGFVTDASAIPAPSRVVDFGQFGLAMETTGPVEIGGSVGESITWTASSPESLIGISTSYGFSANGVWDNKRGGITGTNALDSSMTYTFNTGPVSAVGGFMNYVPGFADVTITALGLGGVVLQTYDVSALAPISTPGGVDAGAFRGVVDATADIYAFRVANGGVGLDDLTFSRQAPQSLSLRRRFSSAWVRSALSSRSVAGGGSRGSAREPRPGMTTVGWQGSRGRDPGRRPNHRGNADIAPAWNSPVARGPLTPSA